MHKIQWLQSKICGLLNRCTLNYKYMYHILKKNYCNTANLRDLIAATGLAILPKWNQIQTVDFSAPIGLKFDGWRWNFVLCDLEIWQIPGPWKTIGHLIYDTSSFVYHFQTIGEFRLELQSRNAQFGWKLAMFLSCVTLKFQGWPWIGHVFYATLSSMPLCA